MQQQDFMNYANHYKTDFQHVYNIYIYIYIYKNI